MDQVGRQAGSKIEQFFGFALRWIKIQIQPTLTLIEPHLCGNLEGENWVKLGQVGSGWSSGSKAQVNLGRVGPVHLPAPHLLTILE